MAPGFRKNEPIRISDPGSVVTFRHEDILGRHPDKSSHGLAQRLVGGLQEQLARTRYEKILPAHMASIT